MTFSAKDLCSRSCMQIRLFQEHPELKPQPNANIKNGIAYQREVASKVHPVGEEMRGTYSNGGLFINFSNDIVCNDRIIEVKSVIGTPPDWYLKSSLLQCAYYKAMIMSGCNQLETATFYVNLGNERKKMTVSPNINYILLFGDKAYDIIVKDRNGIVNFFADKAIACYDWNKAKEFDFNYKHKEYETLEKYFTYENIN